MKLLVTVFDGLDADLIYPNLADFPYLNGLLDSSLHGVLVSDDPMTRSAFYAFYTSLTYLEHQCTYKSMEETGEFINFVNQIKEKTIFDILNDKAIKFGSVGMPLTCKMKVGEFVVGGFPTVSRFQGKLENLIYPISIKDIVNYKNYHYEYNQDVPRIEEISDGEIDANLVPYELDRINVLNELVRRYPVEICFLYFRCFDTITHFLDARYKADTEIYRQKITEYYKKYLDLAIKKVFDEIKADNYLVFSDHGRYTEPEFVHSKNGFHLLNGKDILKSGRVDNNLINMPLTILNLLGVEQNEESFTKRQAIEFKSQ